MNARLLMIVVAAIAVAGCGATARLPVTAGTGPAPVGFIRDNGDAMGRPVGVALDARGALLVADDVGNTVWRVTPASRTP